MSLFDFLKENKVTNGVFFDSLDNLNIAIINNISYENIKKLCYHIEKKTGMTINIYQNKNFDKIHNNIEPLENNKSSDMIIDSHASICLHSEDTIIPSKKGDSCETTGSRITNHEVKNIVNTDNLDFKPYIVPIWADDEVSEDSAFDPLIDYNDSS